MPTYQLLTDRTLAQSSAITPTTLIHIVYTGDPSQNIAGSSYKAELQQLSSIFSGGTDTLVTGGTYSAGTITFTNSSGGTFPVTGLTEPFTGGTVSGATNFTNGLTANTISASTLFVNGVQITGDTFVTGGTYSAGTITFTNNQNGQFPVTGITSSGTTFTGGSGNCIADLYVTNIHGCSPITIYNSIKSTGSTVSGLTSFSFGFETSATTDYSFSKGYKTLASGYSSHSEGGGFDGVSFYSGGTSIGSGSHAEGIVTMSSGFGSHSEGGGTTALGDLSHSEGESTTATGTGSHSEGYGTNSNGSYSHSEGNNTLAFNVGSHAEGDTTIAFGAYSHSEGRFTTAYGDFSHAEGHGTYTLGDYQHATGKWNLSGDSTDGAFIIGNGTNTSNRSNLLFAAGNEVNISGKTITTNLQMTSGATNGYVLTSDASGNASWQNGTFTGGTVTGNTVFTQGLSATTISATTYQNLPLDIKVTGATYSNNSFSYTNNTGGTFSVLFNTVTGLTVNGNLSVTGNTGLGTSSPTTKLDISSLNTPSQVNNTLRFTDTDTVAANNQFNGKIEFYTSDTTGAGVRSYIAGITDTAGDGKIIFGTALGSDTSLTGGTTIGERMRIDENGYVGIGTSSPIYTLDVSSGTETTDEIAMRVANDSNKGVYFAPTAGGSSFNINTRSGDTVIVGSPGESLVIGSNATYAGFRFSGATSAITITSLGWLGLGSQYTNTAEQPSQQLDVEGNARFRAVGATAFFANLNITSDGTLTTATSDIRLKENVEPLNNSLEKLLKLSGVTYNWIGQEGKRIGFIAQEVEKVIPELVFTNNNTEDKIKGIHLDNITAVLVEAIKEQQKIIEELKVRISNLES